MGGRYQGERAVAELIARYDLHAAPVLPVPIRQLARELGWQIVYGERMGRIYGLAVVYRDVRLIQVNAALSHEWQRMTIAHELGHVLNGDASALHLCAAPAPDLAGWLGDRQERRASLTAARLLIPDWAAREYGTVAELAAACEVPPELVELWRAHRARARRV